MKYVNGFRNFCRDCLAPLLVIAGLFAGQHAHAAAIIYGINNDASAILRIDATNSVSTVVYTGAPFPLATRAAAMAQCSNAQLYFVTGGANGTLYRFNPYTPNVAPVAIGGTGAGTPDIIRLSCQPGTDVVYGMGTQPNVIYTFNTATGAATAIALTLPGTTPPVAGSGDIAFHPTTGVLYYIGERNAGDPTTERLWTINLTTNTVANVGAITGFPNVTNNVANGIEFDAAGNLRISLSNTTRLYTAPITGGAATTIGSTGAMPAVFDLAGKDVVPPVDLSITKTDGRTFVSAGDTVTYTIVVTNNSTTYAVTGTVTDTVPASISGVTWTCAATAGSTCGAATGTGNAINTTATLAASGTATYTVTGTLSAGATGTLSNTAAVALPFTFMVDATPANNTATDTTTINQNPAIAKAFAPASIPVNGRSVLTFTLSNPNAADLSGISFTDTYPVGVVNATPLTVGGTCAGVTHTATAGGGTFNVTGGTIPGGAPGTCTITVVVTSAATGAYNNTTSGVLTTQTSSAGAVSNTATLTVVANSLSVTKTVTVLCDPVNFAGNGVTVLPRAIPGAYMRYQITIANAAGGLNPITLTTIADVLDLNLNFDSDLRTGSVSACATSPPESAAGNGFRLSCAGGTRACNTPVFFTAAADSDAIGIAGSSITLNFGDGPAGAKALPTEAGYTAGELKPGESVTIRFNAIVK